MTQIRPDPSYKTTARYYFFNRTPVTQRIKDSMTKEPPAPSLADWKRNPMEFDYKCLDIPNPYPHTYRLNENENGNVEIRIWTDSVKDFELPNAYIEYSKPEPNHIHIENLWVDKENRGKCISDFLVREVLNEADANCWTVTLEARPFNYGQYSKDRYFGNLKKLVNFYSQLGFVPYGDMYGPKKTPRQPMIRKSVCKKT